LLGLLSRTAHEGVQRAMQQYFEDGELRAGTVASLQTFGSYAANFHPHVHALITDGAFRPDGSFERLPYWDASALTELYRRLVLVALRREKRLSEKFHQSLLTWVHSGFSVHVGSPILPGDHDSLEHLGRYITRAPLKIDAVRETAQTVIVPTPQDPRTGQREIELDPLEMIHRLCQQISAPRQHLVRYYGRYSNRSRGARREHGAPAVTTATDEDVTPEVRSRRRSWVRLLRRIFEVDPLLCPRCEVQMRIVAVLTEPTVVDRIVRHVNRTGGTSPFAERAPPRV
jgi:hypothetical protein